MNDKHAVLLKKCVNIITAALTVAAGACLIVACLGIYDGGEGEYSRAAVGEAFSKISFILYLWLGFAVVGIICHFLVPSSEKRIAGKRNGINKEKENFKTNLWVRITLLVIGVVLVAIGVLAGGMADVLAKAINICTECVGLG
ncbi:MAG: hypothetical protein IJC49_01130 [Clostridia bacterium]|nr:hypothetical protein [Clostridia bacterium]